MKTLGLQELAPLHARSLSVVQAGRPASRIESRRRPVATLLAAAAIAVAVGAAYVGYVVRFSTNGVYLDEWNWVDMLGKSYAGTLTLGDLWQQHNENRMLFPKLIALLLGRATAFNDFGFIYLGAAFLVAAVALVAVACRQELLRHPFAYLPALLVFFSLAQYENSLWAFQFAWFMVVACVAGALLLLTAPRLVPWGFVLALAIGVVASYSSIQGLIIWAGGLVALWRPGVTARLRIAWAAAALVVTAFYLHDLVMEPVGGLFAHSGAAIEGFFVTAGSVVPGMDLSVTAKFGVIITAAGCLGVASWLIHGRRDRVLTIAAALIVVGLLFDVMLMPSRLSANVLNGTLSRYTTFNLLLLAGSYIAATRTAIIALKRAAPRRIGLTGAFAGLVLAVLCVQVAAATRAGMLGGAASRAAHAEAADLTANHANAPRTLVAFFAYPTSYDYFQTQAAFLEANHLNVFGDGESEGYQRSGILAGGRVTSPLPVPPELGPIQSQPAKWRAWLALSSVYEQRPDLQKAFPGPTTLASRQMLAWALQSGLDPKDPADSEVLQPYSIQYQVWLAEAAH